MHALELSHVQDIMHLEGDALKIESVSIYCFIVVRSSSC